MSDVITHAINLITKILESSSDLVPDEANNQLIDTRNLLNRLLEYNSPSNDWNRLFCRQLNRLMNYNTSLSDYFWTGLHDDIYYVLEGPNGKQNVGNTWEHFLKKLKFELELEKRAFQFRQTFGERMTFYQLFCKHKSFFQAYLSKCISLHSKIEVRGLVQNLDDLLCRNHELTQAALNATSREYLKQKLTRIEIPFNCSNRSLKRYTFPFVMYAQFSTANSSFSNFLPSAEPSPPQLSYRSEMIESILESYRWIVILGDPGSAKTTFLRWITYVFAEKVKDIIDKIELEQDVCDIVRIPILIRVGELAKWLEQNQT